MTRFARYLLPLLFSCSIWAQDADPHLLLSQRRLHRLKLDFQRRTDRWNNFERRVKTVPDSPQRGFELALYGIVAGDTPSCAAAAKWGFAHKTAYRQDALIADWCAAQLSPTDRTSLLGAAPAFNPANPFRSARDVLFNHVASGKGSRSDVETLWSNMLPAIQHDPRSCLPDLLALFEFIDAAHSNYRIDVRQDDAPLFANLPLIFLLSLSPAHVEHPHWLERIGGLMMVNVDPNLQSSSFVQGWAMEDPKLVSDGPGVAYEFFLANPYLPGLGYYNMDLWVYDAPSSLLLARKSWDENSCWVSIARGTTKLLQCPADTLAKPAQFGKLSLIPMDDECIDVAAQSSISTILSHLAPGDQLTWDVNGDKSTTQADSGGLALVSSTVSGEVCKATAKHKKKRGGVH